MYYWGKRFYVLRSSLEKEAGMRRALGRLLLIGTVLALLTSLPGGVASASDGGRTFHIVLSGANEVPTNVHGDNDRGSVTLTVNLGQAEVCWQFGPLTLTAGESLPHISHIHIAPEGTAGPIVLTLFGAPGNPPPTTTPSAPTSYPTGTVCVENVNRALLVDIFQNPENYYVNMHNDQHPGGVVRGQLR